MSLILLIFSLILVSISIYFVFHSDDREMTQTEKIFFYSTLILVIVLIFTINLENVLYSLGIQIFMVGMVYYLRFYLFRESTELKLNYGLTIKSHKLIGIYTIILCLFVLFNVVNSFIINERSQAFTSGMSALEKQNLYLSRPNKNQPVRNKSGEYLNPLKYNIDSTEAVKGKNAVKAYPSRRDLGAFTSIDDSVKDVMNYGRATRTGKVSMKGFK